MGGEGLGRLGKALKDAYRLEHGFYDEASYWESAAAYQKAVRLLPGDVAWHYGYADLLCDNATNYEEYNRHPDDSWEPLRLCVNQVTTVLKLDPAHQEANEIVEILKIRGLVDMSGPEPAYLVLTPTAMPTDSYTRVKTSTGTPAPTVTVRPSSTATAAQTMAPTVVQAATVEAGPEAGTRSPACGAALLPGMAAVVVGAWRWRAGLAK